MVGKNCGPQIQHIKRQDEIITTKQEIVNILAETFGKNSKAIQGCRRKVFLKTFYRII